MMKISDFGAATDKTDKKKENIYTFNYASPEQIKNKEYTDKCDVYSLGCIFFELLIGKTPKALGVSKPDKIKQRLQKNKVPA